MEVKKKMNSQELRSLQEAYLEVVEGQQLDENRAAMGRINKEYHRKKESEAMAARARDPKVKRDLPKRKNDNPMYDPKSAGSSRVKGFKFTGEEVEHVDEVYKGKHGQTDKQYADSRSQGGKMVSGDSKMSGAEYTHGRRVKAANPGMQPDVGGKTKPKSQGKMDAGTRADLQYRKAKLKKEEFDAFDVVLEFLQVEGYVDTLEEATWMMANIIDEEAIDIILGEDSRRMSNKQHTARVRSNIKSFGSNYTPPSNFDPDANRGKGEVLTRKQIEKKRRKALRQEEFEAWLDEAMSSYDRNRKRAAQRAAARNAARDAGKTGVVPGVGYVTPRRERETYTDEKGTVRHKSGAKMP